MGEDWLPWAVAIIGTGGVGAVITATINSFVMWRKGVSAREDTRKTDIVKARDEAVLEAVRARAEVDAADARADRERDKRIKMQEHAARQRIRLISAGLEPDPWPDDNKKE